MMCPYSQPSSTLGPLVARCPEMTVPLLRSMASLFLQILHHCRQAENKIKEKVYSVSACTSEYGSVKIIRTRCRQIDGWHSRGPIRGKAEQIDETKFGKMQMFRDVSGF